MQIDFRSSERSSLGVEVELEIVDLESRELRSGASEVLPLLGRDHPNGEHPKAKHELLESTIEIITGICTTVEEARRDLEGTLGELYPFMAERGMVSSVAPAFRSDQVAPTSSSLAPAIAPRAAATFRSNSERSARCRATAWSAHR